MSAQGSHRWDQSWTIARTAPELEPHDIHLWYLALDAPLDLAAVRDCLSDDEQRRADRFIFEQHRRRFALGRMYLRQVLGSYLGIEPASVVFEYSGLGKPRIRGSDAGRGLCFNFSNSHERALLGIARNVELGVDIEWLRSIQSMEGMAERFFADAETREILSLPEPQRTESFFCCWTRKEAFLKAIGKGLTFPLRDVVVDVHRRHPVQIQNINDSAQNAAEWSLESLTVEPEYVAAVACRRLHNDLKRFRL